jgi:hypothetical protein
MASSIKPMIINNNNHKFNGAGHGAMEFKKSNARL